MNKLGRLFWRFLAAFWIAMAAVGLLLTSTLYFLRWLDIAPVHPAVQQRAAHMVDTVADLLASGHTEAAHGLLRKWQQRGIAPAVYVVSEDGQKLLSRSANPISTEALEMHRESVSADPELLRRVRVPGSLSANMQVFVREDELRAAPPGPPLGGPPLYLPALVAGIIGLLFSALLAWSVARPIHRLRWALHEVAEGRLETRVTPLMGQRKDEIGDLGQDFDRMAMRLQQLVGSQRRLLHDVSHELRSPLARMRAAIDLAHQRPERISALLERLEHESERLDKLVGELLTLARLDSDSSDLRSEHIDVMELISSIAQDARFEAQASGREVSLRIEGEFYADVVVEPLYRAFENVVRNAIRHASPSSTVEIEALANPGGLEVLVHDRGPGVPEESLSSIFEPFVRLGQGWSEGAGLGLAIARRALAIHGGSITPLARPGGGLTMHIVIPRRATATPLE